VFARDGPGGPETRLFGPLAGATGAAAARASRPPGASGVRGRSRPATHRPRGQSEFYCPSCRVPFGSSSSSASTIEHSSSAN
jgi:hypothetical protein